MRSRFFATTWVEILFILLVSLSVITWFRGNNIIMTSASVWPLDWHMYLQKTLYVWDDSIGTGEIASRQIAVLPLALVGAGLEALHVPASLIQGLLFFYWFAGSGVAMWWLTKVFGFSRLVRVTSALAYMASPFALISVWSQTDGLLMPTYVVLPLGLALFVRLLQQRFLLLSIIIANLVLIGSLSSALFLNPTYIILFWLPLLLAAGGAFIWYRWRWRSVICTTIVFGVVWLLIHAFVFVPLLSSLVDEFFQASHTIIQAEDPTRIFRSDLDTYYINSVAAADSFRLSGLWSVAARHESDPYYVWGGWYEGRVMRSLMFLVPFMMMLGLYYYRGQPAAAFFGVVWLLGAFWLIGTHPPGETVRVGFFEMMPVLLRAFRAAYSKWGFIVALGEAPLVGMGAQALYEAVRIRGRAGAWLAVLIMMGIIVGVGGWPVWSGAVINPGGKVLQTARVHVPDFYHDFQKWQAEQMEAFRLLPLPLSKTGSTAYHWANGSGYVGGDFVRWFSPQHPVLFAGTRNPLMLAVVDGVTDQSWLTADGLRRILGLLNVRYIVNHRDFYWPMNRNFMMFNDEGSVARFMTRADLRTAKTIGDLDLLLPEREAWRPKLHASTSMAYVVSSGAHLLDAMLTDDTTDNDVYYVHDRWRLAENEWVRGQSRRLVVTTSFDEEALAQARRELSDARAARLPSVSRRETEINLLQRVLTLPTGHPLLVPEAGDYTVYLARAWLADQASLVTIEFKGSNGQQETMRTEPVGRQADLQGKRYAALGHVRLQAGDMRLSFKVGEQAVSNMPPGTLLLEMARTETANEPPAVTFVQESPTRYVGHVSKSNQPFWLIFSETYHRQWQAARRLADGRLVWMPSNQHVMVNGYANGWRMEAGSESDIIIFFAGQWYAYIGLVISATALGGGLLWIVSRGIVRYTTGQ